MDRAVRADDCGRTKAVDRQPVLATHPALPTSEGEAAHTRLRHDATGHDEPERLGLTVDIGPDGAALDGGPPGDRIDRHGLHPSEVDHDATITARQTGDGVAAPPHRDQQVPLTGEVDGGDHVGGAGRSDLERGVAGVHRVVDRIGVKVLIRRPEHIAPDPGAELLELGVLDLRLAASKRGNHHRHRLPLSLALAHMYSDRFDLSQKWGSRDGSDEV